MYATRSRKVKTDKRDARTLAEACRLGAYRPAHRTSDEQRHVRAQLAVREAMVRTRSRYISLVSTLLRRNGLRIHNSGYTPTFLKRLAQLELSASLREEIAPLVLLLQSLNEQIKQADHQLAALAEGNEVLARLRTVPGVGVITATSFVSTLDEAERFAGAKQARAYLGLVPSERSSGERQQRGHISKAGPGRARTCWSKPHGLFSGAGVRPTRPCMIGPQRSWPGAAPEWQSWRWRGNWLASSTL
jgi:transposase